MKKKQVAAVDDNDEASTSSSEQEEDDKKMKIVGDKGKAKLVSSSSTITEYEKQRQQRIEENRAKLQALRLPVLASSLSKNSNKKLKNRTSQKAKSKQDNDYQPSTEDEQSESSSDEDAEHKVLTPKVTPAKRGPPGRPKSKKMKSLNSLIVDKASEDHGWNALQQTELDDDAALQQALALSMGVSMEDATAIAEASKPDSEVGRPKAKVDNSEKGGKSQETAKVDKFPGGRRQRKQTKRTNTIQLSEDEVLAYFFFFDEAGKGKISVRDLERVALTYDFTWSKHELNEMVDAFDKDCDGQLSLEDFQTIVARCNMIGGS